MRADPLTIVEAGYAPEPDTGAWLDGLAEAARPFDPGGGLAAYLVEFPAEGPTVAARGPIGPMVEGWLRGVPAHVLRALTRPYPKVVDTFADMAGMLAPTGVSVRQVEQMLVDGAQRPLVEAAMGGDHEHVVTLSFVSPDGRKRLRAADKRVLSLVMAHVGTAARLRARSGEIDAWLSPSGRVLDARGTAQSNRESLAEAVVRTERARGALRRRSPEEAVALWRALVRAEWSVVDSVERDGKRVLVARRNRPVVPSPPALTPIERAVAFYAAAGHSYKLIGYQLGLAVSTVAGRLRSALLKLGLRSRAQLARIFATQPETTASDRDRGRS